MKSKKLTDHELHTLFSSVTKYGTYRPVGLFYYRDKNIVVGVDNSTGEAWTEEFSSVKKCLAWLNQK